MRIRALLHEDIPRVQEIYKDSYPYENDFPDFTSGFLGAYVVLNDNEQIIAAGGLKSIAVAELIIDKKENIGNKREAMLQILDFSRFLAKEHKFEEINAFIDDEKWLKHLISAGFVPTKGMGIVLKV